MRVGCSVCIENQNAVVVDQAAYVQDFYEDSRRTYENVRQGSGIDLSKVPRKKAILYNKRNLVTINSANPKKDWRW